MKIFLIIKKKPNKIFNIDFLNIYKPFKRGINYILISTKKIYNILKVLIF